nr:hypothetical protein [Tanacetum cinerariifolium]
MEYGGNLIEYESSAIDSAGKAVVVDSCVGGIGVLVDGSETHMTIQSIGIDSQVWIQESNDGKRFFFFKFSSIEGVDSVLHDGPWMICGIPIFLNKWSPS